MNSTKAPGIFDRLHKGFHTALLAALRFEANAQRPIPNLYDQAYRYPPR